MEKAGIRIYGDKKTGCLMTNPKTVKTESGVEVKLKSNPTMMASILEWGMELGGRGKVVEELPFLRHIDVFQE